jgi:pectate lyase
MRSEKSIAIALAFLPLLAMSTPAHAAHADLGREVLPTNDGWASIAPSTTGGTAAAAAQVYVVTNRAELVAALNNGVFSSPPPIAPSNEPKIIYVDGVIDLNVDDSDQPLYCEDYYRNGFTIEAFLAQFDPAGPWGRVNPSGPLETARIASNAAQQERVRMRIGSNTTIVGVDKHATILGGWFDLRGTAAANRTNIIIRNLRFEDTFDCFPQWAPTDGALGSWNALYDSISLRDTNHVWIDHNTFVDIDTSDDTLPTYFGRLFQVHDGLVDITNASNHVTVSWNTFENHDKVMLIGSSDNAPADVGKLKVTLHHNQFADVGQRAARVRYGQVHIYNNFYKISNPENYQYSWGVGFQPLQPAPPPQPPQPPTIQSGIFAQNNFIWVNPSSGITIDQFIERLNGVAVLEMGTMQNSPSESGQHVVDLVSEYNAVNNPDLLEAVGWAPTLFTTIDDTQDVMSAVNSHAGPSNW